MKTNFNYVQNSSDVHELVYAVISIFEIKFVTMFLEQRYNLTVAWVFVFMVSGLSSVVTPGGFPYESGVDDRPVP